MPVPVTAAASAQYLSMAPRHQAVLPNALKVPGLTKLHGKRVVLASASPRRKEILKTFVRLLQVHPLYAYAQEFRDNT